MRSFGMKLLLILLPAGFLLFLLYQFLSLQNQNLAKQTNNNTELSKTNEELKRNNEALQNQVKELQRKFLDQEQAWLKLSEDLKKATSASHTEAAAANPDEKNPLLPNRDEATQELIRRFNRTLVADKILEWKLFDCEGVKEGVLLQATLYHIGVNGAVNGTVFAEEIRVILPPVPQVIWLICKKGYVIEEGQKQTFSEYSHKIEMGPANVEHWSTDLPELFVSRRKDKESEEEKSNSRSEPKPSLTSERLIQRLNQLLKDKATGYRFKKISASLGGVLQNVTIEKLDEQGKVEKIYRAETVRAQFDQEQKTVELILEKGYQEKDGQLTALPNFGFLITLSTIRSSEWTAAGGPSPR